MSQDNSSTQKTTKISLTGDVEKCGHCKEDDKKFRDLSSKTGYSYEYIDVNSERGQQNLKDWGVKENEKVDIPIVKAETCINTGTEQKKCKVTDWKDNYLQDLESGKLPEEVTDV